MPEEKIIIVNDNDEVIGSKERGTLAAEDIYRVSGLWVTNSKGDVLMTKRSLNKKKDPGLWQPAVAGTNDEGETYYSNIIKEAEEEIGMKNFDLKEGPKRRIKENVSNFFVQWYLAVIDLPLEGFKTPPDEVIDIKWFDSYVLKEEVTHNPKEYVSTMKYWVELFITE